MADPGEPVPHGPPTDDAVVQAIGRAYQSRYERDEGPMRMDMMLRAHLASAMNEIVDALRTLHIVPTPPGRFAVAYRLSSYETEALLCADGYGERTNVLEEDRQMVRVGTVTVVGRFDEVKQSAEEHGTSVVVDRIRLHLAAVDAHRARLAAEEAAVDDYESDDDEEPYNYNYETPFLALMAMAMIPFANDREGPDEYMPALREAVRQMTARAYLGRYTMLDPGTLLAIVWQGAGLPPNVVDEMINPGPRVAVYFYHTVAWWVLYPRERVYSEWVPDALFLARRALERNPDVVRAINDGTEHAVGGMPPAGLHPLREYVITPIFLDLWTIEQITLFLALLGDLGIKPTDDMLEVMRTPVPPGTRPLSVKQILHDYYNGTGLLAEAERLLRTTPESVLTATSDVLRRANEERKEGARNEAEAKRYAYVTLLGADVASLIAQYVNGTVPRRRGVFRYNVLLPGAQRAAASTDGERPTKRSRTEARFQACPHCHDGYARVY